MSGIYPKSDYWDAQSPEFREEVLGHVITMEREYAGRQRVRTERDEQKSTELAAVIAEARAKGIDHTSACDAWADMNGSPCTCGVAVLSVPTADVLSAYTTRIREEALAEIKWEYGWRLIEDTGEVAERYWPFDSAAEAREHGENYAAGGLTVSPDLPPLHVGLMRRAKAGEWSEIPEGQAE